MFVLGALIDFSARIWAYFRQENPTKKDIDIYFSLRYIIYYEFYFLFLELAIMLNIAKWIYFYLLIQTHRNIRIYEINQEIFPEGNNRKKVVSNNANGTDNTTVDKSLLSDNNNKSDSIKQ